MVMARWQATIQDTSGNVQANAQVQVRREVTGLPLARLFADPDGEVPLANPFTADENGYAFFYAVGGFLRIRATKGAFTKTWPDVAHGTAQAYDVDQFGVGADTDRQVDTLADRETYDDEEEGFSVLVSDIGDGRAAIYSKNSAASGDWSDPAIITGKQGVGRGIDFNVVVADLAERADYDGEAEGFTVLVSNSGDGRSAAYVKLSATSGDWSDPNYLVGDRFDLSIFIGDFPHSGEIVLRHVFSQTGANFEAGLADSSAKAEVGSTGTAVFSIQKNGVEIGTVTFDASATGDFELLGGASFVKDDVLSLVAPAPQDETLLNVSITLAGMRPPA
jgi:predicted RNA-binding protein with TRAM domain